MVVDSIVVDSINAELMEDGAQQIAPRLNKNVMSGALRLIGPPLWIEARRLWPATAR